jgi:3',5'-cyclic AMP phosphodiesterase CpdA
VTAHEGEPTPAFTRREIFRIVAGILALALGGLVLWAAAWDYVRWTEDFLPGSAPRDVLQPDAWTVTDESVVFLAVGDTGTGGRNQMDIAQAMVDAYKENPFGFVAHVGDVSYRGSIVERWEEVWLDPYSSLLDAGVQFEVALGNHELQEGQTEETIEWIEARLDQLGYDNAYRVVPYGPIDFFFIDSSTPLVTGVRSGEQLAWLEEALAASEATWKIAVMHHAPYSSSAKRGSNLEVRAAVEPLFIQHGVQLALTGHDHIYERTHPQSGVTYIVTGAGAKLSDVGTSDFTALSAEVLQFMRIEIDEGLLAVEAIDITGTVFDRVTLDATGEVVP